MVQAAPSFAETLFRLDASAPGEADPDKGIDYVGSVLAFNLYDALVAPGQNGTPVAPHLASAWKVDGADYIFTLRPDVKFHSGNVMTADDVVFSFKRLMALGKGNSPLFAGRVASRRRGRSSDGEVHLVRPLCAVPRRDGAIGGARFEIRDGAQGGRQIRRHGRLWRGVPVEPRRRLGRLYAGQPRAGERDQPGEVRRLFPWRSR